MQVTEVKPYLTSIIGDSGNVGTTNTTSASQFRKDNGVGDAISAALSSGNVNPPSAT